MGSKSPTPIAEHVDTIVETLPKGSPPCKKIQKKVPRIVHKAEREKLKREHLNELFLDLANALELSEQTNGKACLLNETARFVKDMLSQIEHLKRENTALLSESQYVRYNSVLEMLQDAFSQHYPLSMEKKELQDEKFALEAQIGKLEGEVKERVAETNLDLNLVPPETQQAEFASQVTDNYLRQMQIMNHVYVVPLNSTPQVYPEPDAAMATSSVKKPQARYPTPADAWPSQILENNLN